TARAAIEIHELVEPNVVDWPRKVMHRIAIDRVRERGKLPGPDVSSQDEYTFSGSLCFQKVFMPFNFYDLLDILAGVAWKSRDLHGLPGEIARHPANGFASLYIRPIWECRSQIESRDSRQSRQ